MPLRRQLSVFGFILWVNVQGLRNNSMDMQDIIFAIVQVTFNASVFIVMNVTSKFNRFKKVASTLLVVSVIVGSLFLFVGEQRYELGIIMSGGMFLLISMRFVISKFRQTDKESYQQKAFQNAIDTLLFPLFVVFFTIAQCLLLF
jgi:hypothetical protein